MHKLRIALPVAATLLVHCLVVGQTTKPNSLVIPAVITNHYDKSQIKSHGVVRVMPDEERVRVDVRDAAKNSEYEIVLLNEASGDRKKVGSFKTDGKGSASGEFSAKDLLKTHNALLVMDGEDVVQYAQLQETHHGCICKHSGGTVVTRKLDQECFECPCGVKYEICCGGPKK